MTGFFHVVCTQRVVNILKKSRGIFINLTKLKGVFMSIKLNFKDFIAKFYLVVDGGQKVT